MSSFIPLPVGTLLENRFRLIENPHSRKINDRHLLGSGGSGAVYLAQDLTLNCEVAIKQSILLDEKSVLMFRREAEFLANLNHPALPKVSGFFSNSESCFIVMDLIRGDDLEERVTESGKLPFSEVKEIALQLLEVLDYLHTHSIIHKDIKPANLKYTSDGELKVLDFGFAKGSVGLMSEHKETIVKGVSPAWASPEQLAFEPATPQSDLYSAAGTLYFLATGIAPPDASIRTMSIAISGEDLFLSLSTMHAGVPDWFAALVNEALSLTAEARPQSARAMRERVRSELVFGKLEPMLTEATKLFGSFGHEFEEIMSLAITAEHKAVKFIERGNYWLGLRRGQYALNHFNTALALNPACVDAYLGRGSAHSSQRDFKQAIQDYSEAIKLQPSLIAAYQQREAVYKVIGEKALAAADHTKVVELRRSLPFFRRYPRKRVFLYSIIFLSFLVSVGIVVLYVSIRPGLLASDYFNEGNDCFTKADYQCAISNYSHAIELNAKFLDAYLKRGASHVAVGDYAKGMLDLDRVINARPDYADAYLWRGRAYAGQKRYKEAIADYSDSIRMRPNDDVGYFYRALAFYYEGAYDETIADYTKYLRRNPNDAAAHYNLALAYDQKELYDEAITNYSEAIRIRPDDAQAFYNRARDYDRKKRYDEAIADYGEYIKLRPNDFDGYFYRGVDYYHEGDATKGRADLEKAHMLRNQQKQ